MLPEPLIPGGFNRFQTVILNLYNHTTTWKFNPCSYAFLVDQDAYDFKVSDLADPRFVVGVSVVFEWAIGETAHAKNLGRT